MHVTNPTGFLIAALTGIVQGPESHVGWWAELHWMTTTAFLLFDAASDMLNGRTTKTLDGAAVVVLVLIAVLARMLKRVWKDAAAMFERVFPNGECCAYFSLLSTTATLCSYGDMTINHATLLCLGIFGNVAAGMYLVYLLHDVLRECKWKLHDTKRRFIRWVWRYDAQYTGDTVDAVVEFRYAWTQSESDDEDE